MDRMRSPEPRIILMSVALIGIGSMTGAFLDRLSFPRVSRIFNTCASSKQFLVEFRQERDYWQAYRTGMGSLALSSGPTLEVDGVLVGPLSYWKPLRHFFCEGNHTAHVRYSGSDGQTETHTIEFAVSRPSLFQLSQEEVRSAKAMDCNSADPCTSGVGLQLSPYEPDDPNVRVYPREESR
jgi:hypothetical protein